MSSTFATINECQEILRSSWDKMLINLCKTLIISILVIYILAIFISHNPNCQPSEICSSSQHFSLVPSHPLQPQNNVPSPFNISHILFGISGSANAWKARKSYIESWWLPNITRGYLFLDKVPPAELLPWPSTYPPFRISEDTSNFKVYATHILPSVIRVVRVILETFRQQDKGVQWFVMGDDDTIFVLDNLVEVLSKYDHTKYYYIGGVSECTKSNFDFSYEMAFGGGGFAISYPLAATLVKHLDDCINRYPFIHVSDRILQSCIGDLGVSLTPDKGFHQLDLVGDISGLLSAHPQTPLISLHHFDIVLPIFPTMDRHDAAHHLMKAAKVDHSRILQQTICYHRPTNWSFSIAWGYSAQIYEQILPRNVLKRPLETFRPWSEKAIGPLYMFNTRPVSNNPCGTPHVFFLESIDINATTNQIITTYLRAEQRRLPPCPIPGSQPANRIYKVKVLSTASKPVDNGKGECCDIVHVGRGRKDMAEAKLRACLSDEIMA